MNDIALYDLWWRRNRRHFATTRRENEIRGEITDFGLFVGVFHSAASDEIMTGYTHLFKIIYLYKRNAKKRNRNKNKLDYLTCTTYTLRSFAI